MASETRSTTKSAASGSTSRLKRLLSVCETLRSGSLSWGSSPAIASRCCPRTGPNGRSPISRFLVSARLTFLSTRLKRSIKSATSLLTPARVRSSFPTRKLFRHAQKALEGLEFLERIIFFDDPDGDDIERSTTLESLEEIGLERANRSSGGVRALISRRSGPTIWRRSFTPRAQLANPKGVMLTHANFVSNVQSIVGGLPISSTDIALSVLPLSHIFERTGFYIFCYAGVSVYYTASFDQVAENLREVRPTVMTAVPRLFEKVYHKIVKKGFAEKGWKRKVFVRSLDVGQRYAEAKDKRKLVGPALGLQQRWRIVWCFLSGARSWRSPAVFRFRRRATVAGSLLRVSRRRNSDSAGLRRDRKLHRFGKSSRQQSSGFRWTTV